MSDQNFGSSGESDLPPPPEPAPGPDRSAARTFPSRGRGRPIALATALVLLLAVIVWMLYSNGQLGTGSSPAPPSSGQPAANRVADLTVGQCVQLIGADGATPDPEDGSLAVGHRVIDCDTAGRFKLLVGAVYEGGGACPQHYVEYFIGNVVGEGKQVSACLAPVFDAGTCYVPDPVSEWVVVDCSDGKAYFRVESVHEGADPDGCVVPEDAVVLPRPAPGSVYCLVSPGS